MIMNAAAGGTHLKWVSASGAPLGLPACPACFCDSLTTLRYAGFSACFSFLRHADAAVGY